PLRGWVRSKSPSAMFQRRNRRVTFVLTSAGALACVGLPEAVPHAADRLDTGHRRSRSRELRPEPRDVNVHGPGLDEPVFSPDHVEKLLATEDPAGGPDERCEQLDLLRRHLHALALHRDLEATAIDLEVTRLEVVLALGGLGALAAPHHSTDPGDQ